MLSKITKIKLSLIVLSVLAFSLPLTSLAQTPPGGTLSITTNTLDNLVTTQAGPSYVFWYLISGYPSPSNPWLPVATQNGTGVGTTIVAEGNYGIFQQSDYQDWRLTSFTCTNSGGNSGTELPDLGVANVGIINGETTNCIVDNKYIATGELTIAVSTDGGSADFKFAVEHNSGTGGIERKNVTVATEGTRGEKTIELHADSPTATGSSDFLNSYTIKIGEGISTGEEILPPGWSLNDVTCQRQDSSQVGTYDNIWAISPVPVESRKKTTCTFEFYQEIGTIEIYSNLGSDSASINKIEDSVPDQRPVFTYQLGGFMGNSTGNLSIGAAGSFYYPLPYYLQLQIGKFPETDTDESPRPYVESRTPWAWGKETLSVNPGIYYIQQNAAAGWESDSVTCVQVFNEGQSLINSDTPALPQPATGDQIFIDEKNNWVKSCTSGTTANCCSFLISKFYKDTNHPPVTGFSCQNSQCVSTPGGTATGCSTEGNNCSITPPSAPPLLNYGNPEKCSFGTTSPTAKQFNISLNNNSMASVPVAPGGKTICIFNNREKDAGSGGRGGTGEFENPIKGTNPEAVE